MRTMVSGVGSDDGEENVDAEIVFSTRILARDQANLVQNKPELS